jgi:hypothetical protein
MHGSSGLALNGTRVGKQIMPLCIPDAHIHDRNWCQKSEWALLIPAYGMFLVLMTYFVYFALAIAGTPPFSDIRTIVGAFRSLTNYLGDPERHRRFAFAPSLVR